MLNTPSQQAKAAVLAGLSLYQFQREHLCRRLRQKRAFPCLSPRSCCEHAFSSEVMRRHKQHFRWGHGYGTETKKESQCLNHVRGAWLKGRAPGAISASDKENSDLFPAVRHERNLKTQHFGNKSPYSLRITENPCGRDERVRSIPGTGAVNITAASSPSALGKTPPTAKRRACSSKLPK